MNAHQYIYQLQQSQRVMRLPTFWEKLHLDIPLFISLGFLAIYGFIILYSATGENAMAVSRQATHYAIGIVAMIIVSQISPRILYHWSPWVYLASIGLLVGVLLFGDISKGARRWLSLGGFRFQPSELTKLALPMAVAWFLSQKELPVRFSHIIFSSLIIACPVILVIKQPDLGTALLILATGCSVVLFAGLSWRIIGLSIGLATAAAPLFWFFMHDYQKQRVLTFLNPESDPLGTGWNIIQSKIAIGSGGIFGKGWLNGSQSRLDFLPERSTDFIFAVCSEEFGLIGVLTLIVLYLAVIIRGFYIGLIAQDTYSRLLAASLSLTFFVYIFINVGMVSGLLPIVGLPLPLISYGGSSIVTLLVGFGILMSIRTHRKLVSD